MSASRRRTASDAIAALDAQVRELTDQMAAVLTTMEHRQAAVEADMATLRAGVSAGMTALKEEITSLRDDLETCGPQRGGGPASQLSQTERTLGAMERLWDTLHDVLPPARGAREASAPPPAAAAMDVDGTLGEPSPDTPGNAAPDTASAGAPGGGR